MERFDLSVVWSSLEPLLLVSECVLCKQYSNLRLMIE